ncbi:MAG: P-type conjugative transfer protein TrbJ [Candidatus Tectimicrobiota bacterium]
MRCNRGVRGRRIVGVLALVASLLAGPRPGAALFGVGDIVFDPTNLLQNTLTALRTLQSNLNEATQIAHQVRMVANQVQQLTNQVQQLAHEAQNLATLPLSLWQDLQAQLQTYTALLHQAQGISFQLNQVPAQIAQLYATAGQPARSSAALLQQASRWTQQLQQASATAMQVQSVWERLTGQQTRLQRALTASDTAGGNLQVSQATNQLLGVLAEQQGSLQQMLAASGRAEASLLALQAAQDEAARAQAAHFMDGFTTMTPVQGIGIPPFR